MVDKQLNDNLNWGNNLNRCFFSEGIQIVNKHLKRYSSSLMIREMQI